MKHVPAGLLGVFVVFLCTIPAQAGTLSLQTAQQPPAEATPPDPLSQGRKALQKNDYATAQTFFETYLKSDPNNAEALDLEGVAYLGLKRYEDAERSYLAALKLDPARWTTHKNLVVAYATLGKWKEFDEERALVEEARAKGTPGLGPRDVDVIDVFYIASERYIVRSYAELNGRFKARYNFAHFAPDGKLDSWILCESDDVDQTAFAKAHPTEAAAGQRSFSLDSYTARKLSEDGKTYTQTHGTIKFYPDGEPSYETVRSDVLAVLEHKVAPMSSTTSGKPATPETATPAKPK
jgi:tetratricopeptide (TPR) repeat protein